MLRLTRRQMTLLGLSQCPLPGDLGGDTEGLQLAALSNRLSCQA
jgi:hypothetical protein